MWEYVLGGATVFGLIMGLFSIYNGRVTRRGIAMEMRVTRELIAKMDERLLKIDERMSEGFLKMSEGFSKMDERFGALLQSIRDMAKQSMEEHRAILEAIKSASAK